MASIFFKRGLKENLENAQLRDGTIYVTTDERAMYVDCYDSVLDEVKRIRLGDFHEYINWQAIQQIPVTDLDVTALYYAQEENILCKWTGDDTADYGGWVQINAQSTIRELIKTITTVTTAVTNGTKVTANLLNQSDAVERSGDITFLSGNSNKLKITGTTTSGKATVTFTPESIVENASIGVVTTNGETNLVLTNLKTGTDANGTAVNTSSSVSLPIIGSGVDVSEDNGALVITNLGGIKSNGLSNSFDAQGNYKIVIETTNNTTIQSANLMPKIRYGQTAVDAVFANGIAVLDIYTKTEVDDKIALEMKAANAMTFKGAVGLEPGSVSADLPTSNVHNGDVYLVSSEGNFGNDTFMDCVVGDMFVATGTEGTDGVIPAANISWVYIPSGNDTPQSYSFRYNTTNQKIEFLNAVGNVVTGFTAGTDIVFGGSNNQLTIGHATVTRTDTNGTAQEADFMTDGDFTMEVVTGVTTSQTGHVTGVEKTQFKLDDVSNAVRSVAVTASTDGTTGNGKIKIGVQDRYNTREATIELHSESLSFSNTGNVTNIDMEWGSF